MRASSVAAVVAASLTLATGARAQAVRGTVVTPDSIRVSGVIVTLIDSVGTPVARALADDGGRFTMRAPAPGTYRIEAKRLAFRPTLDVPIKLDSGRVLLHTLVLRGAPVQLDEVTRGPHTAVYHAPDEDVLLSESFGATHCLRILPDSGTGNVVRLGFSPLPGRRQPEIVGVLSIDRASSERRRLDFNYVNLPAIDVVGTPGGEIVFRRLPEGSWLIEQWAIWLPIAQQRADIAPALPMPNTRVPVRQAPAISTRYGLQTTGGHVIAWPPARRPSG